MSDDTRPPFDYGEAAEDYARYRAGFPPRFFDRLAQMGLGLPGQQIIDVGCGTGTLALGFAERGAQVMAIDASPAMIAMTQRLADDRGLPIKARVGQAASFDARPRSVDLVTCGQCWHWFDRPRAAAHIFDALKPGGALVICHLDWLARPNTPAGLTLALTEAMGIQPGLNFDAVGIYPQWTRDVAEAGFVDTETFSFEWAAPYDIESWRGRIRASAWADPTLDGVLAATLSARWPRGHMTVPHRVWALIARRPEG